jgi:hypothetical protein
MKYRYIIIDVNNLFWRSVVDSGKLFSVNQANSKIEVDSLFQGIVQESLKRVKYLSDKFGYSDSDYYFLMDNPNSQINRRKIISEGQYKHARDKKKVPEQFYKTLNIFAEILKVYSDNYYIVRSEGLEADDLTFPVIKQLNFDYYNRGIVISADLDWARNIQEFCHWFNWIEVYDFSSFEKKYGYPPLGNRIKMVKSISGDSSDSIPPGVPYFPKDLMYKLIEKYNSINELLQNLWRDPDIPDQWKKKIFENSTQLQINYQLVDFIPINKPLENFIVKGQRNIKECRIWFNVLKLPLEDWMMSEKEQQENFFHFPE